jgi:hypothetical protein
VKGLEVRTALRSRTHDEQRSTLALSQLAGGEHREGRGAPGSYYAAVKEAEPFPRRRIHHDDLALYRR